jgi:hypothetical protein
VGDHARDQENRGPADALYGLAEVRAVEQGEPDQRHERGAPVPGDRDRLRPDLGGDTAAGGCASAARRVTVGRVLVEARRSRSRPTTTRRRRPWSASDSESLSRRGLPCATPNPDVRVLALGTDVPARRVLLTHRQDRLRTRRTGHAPTPGRRRPRVPDQALTSIHSGPTLV